MRSALVIGAGVFGLSLARELAARAWHVDLVDRHPAGAGHGPSYADTRILRCAHGTDAFYATSARRARTLWRELEGESGTPFLHTTGVLLLASGTDTAWERASLDTLRRLGIPAEHLPAAALAGRFPGVDGDGVSFAVHEPDGGVLEARTAMRALAASAARRGVRTTVGTAVPEGDGARVDGEHLGADLVVWAVGPDLPALFPGRTPVVTERQDSYRLPALGPWAAGGPAWIDRSARLYGVPAIGGTATVKIVPDTEATGAAELPSDARRYVAARFPGLAAAPVVRREECAYAWSPDEHFLLDRLPGARRTWLVGGDSGHGFKHGPAWAAYVAGVLEGTTTALPRFALQRPLDPPREPREQS
ncbi:FAD-dependent oxidoreductase [Streptomyces sp. ISL-11]|uniref:FAD-dependent oxidoreductase n=1 Tax=Streptomyces sp. ISL-11 TaxID=2819174 RepID=UPI001BE67509|nr:FAD-dependent oxidoreductase [Streptomyces sp. ISL-11]MBT2383464.1 FAD-dependent oxidoreductase [Streptomyces sp. ISL-11]